MPYCTECGTRNENSLKFCTSCGARLEAVPSQLRISPISVSSPAASGLTTAESIVVGGAALVILSFFLPWFSAPPGLGLWGTLGRPERITGVGLFNVVGASILLVPVLAALAAALVFLFRQAPRATRLRVAGWQIFLGAPSAVTGVQVLFLPAVPMVLSVGFYGATLGYLAILVGGFVLLNRLSREG